MGFYNLRLFNWLWLFYLLGFYNLRLFNLRLLNWLYLFLLRLLNWLHLFLLRCWGVVAVNYDGLEMSEWLVHHITHNGIRGEGYLVVSSYHHSLASIHVYRTAFLHLLEFEGTEALNLYYTVLKQSVVDYLYHVLQKIICYRHRHLVLLHKKFCYIFYCCHNYPLILSFNDVLGLKFTTSFGGTSIF